MIILQALAYYYMYIMLYTYDTNPYTERHNGPSKSSHPFVSMHSHLTYVGMLLHDTHVKRPPRNVEI